jgi:hypothetical protein
MRAKIAAWFLGGGLDLNQRPPGCGTEIALSGYVLDAAQKTTDNFLDEILTMLSYNGI